jgi:hypothetical protein
MQGGGAPEVKLSGNTGGWPRLRVITHEAVALVEVTHTSCVASPRMFNIAGAMRQTELAL